MKRLFPLVLLAIAALAGVWWVQRPAGGAGPIPELRMEGGDASGFARAEAVRSFSFPADHGPHFDFQTEWWYYTGNLDTEDGRHLGYQLTFFRRGLTPGLPPERGSAFATNQIYFAHFAVTDVSANRHTSAERFSRGAGDLAGATGEPYAVWLEDWRVESLSADGSAVRLAAKDGERALELTLRAAKPIVAHGDRGLSPKSEVAGNASYYLSYTRMQTGGQVTLDGQTFSVTGESWFDHEWSTSALGPKAVGWDWFSLQLSDNRELMFFQIRQEDGTVEPVSGGTLIEADGRAIGLSREEVRIDVEGHWTSEATGGEYPARWRVRIPSAGIDLEVAPWIPEQEMRVSFVYWEGAVRVSGTSQAAPVSGNGYIEMTGYVRSMQGEF